MVETRRVSPLKHAIAGCMVASILTLPGLAQAQEAPPKAMLVAPPGPVLKAKRKFDNHAKASSSADEAAALQPGATLASIPQPPPRPRSLAAASQVAPPPTVGEDIQTASIAVATPAVPGRTPALSTLETPTLSSIQAPAGSIDALISKHAALYKMPESLLRRVVKRESGFNPLARNGSFFGLMQMRLDTARGMGYRGGSDGLLDADTNLTYGAAYLANAWRVAGGSQDRAVRLYSSGYYYEAKRKGLLPHLIKGSPSR